MRASFALARKKRHKKILAQAKGFHGARRYRLSVAKETLYHAMRYQTRDRRAKKREFRKLWTARINAFVRAEGISYSRFIEGLHKAGVVADRKILSYLAMEDPSAMSEFVKIAKKQVA